MKWLLVYHRLTSGLPTWVEQSNTANCVPLPDWLSVVIFFFRFLYLYFSVFLSHFIVHSPSLTLSLPHVHTMTQLSTHKTNIRTLTHSYYDYKHIANVTISRVSSIGRAWYFIFYGLRYDPARGPFFFNQHLS